MVSHTRGRPAAWSDQQRACLHATGCANGLRRAGQRVTAMGDQL